MWYVKSLWLHTCLLLASCSVFGQSVFHNDGNIVHISPGAVVYVEGGVNNHNNGQLSNGGTFHFSDDWRSNTAVSDDVDDQDGTFVFEGQMQEVYGFQEVAFPNIQVSNLTENIDQRGTHVSVRSFLHLNEAEWSTGSNLLTILNTDTAAITRTEGYVSSDTIGGALIRKMDRIADYVFPVGSSLTDFRNPFERYRPVVITPSTADPHDFSVRFSNVSASNDFTDGGMGFDIDLRDPTLTAINDEYYHEIDRLVGTAPADLRFFYEEEDGGFSTVAQRQDNDIWFDAYGDVTPNDNPPDFTDSLDRVAILEDHDDFTQPLFALADADIDDDGVADRLDLDADNDGIANIEEVPSNPYFDHDGDGFFDYVDPDFPGCGTFLNGVCSNFDFDLDGLANHLDLDSDGDGIYDIVEAGGEDLDFDAQVEYQIPGVAASMLDLDYDGFFDPLDYLVGGQSPDAGSEVTSGIPLPFADRDNDGLPNAQDIDSDGDGIIDFVEGQTTVGFYFPDYVDGNRNGIDNAFDFGENGIYVVVPTDSDGDGQPDYLDLNSDNERTSDLAEGNDLSGDGLIDPADLPLGTDADGDGLDDTFDTNDRFANPAINSGNNQFALMFPNFENPATQELDWREQGCKQQDCQPVVTARNQP